MIPKIAVLTNMPTPYRNGMWKAYSQIKDAELTFYYCTKKENDRSWNVPRIEGISEKFLTGITFFNHIHVNFGILSHFKKYDAWIIGGYNTFTYQLLIVLCKLFKIPYILMIDGINPQRLKTSKKKPQYLLKKFYVREQFLSLANGTIGKKFMNEYGLSDDKIINQFLTVDVDWFTEHGKNKKEYRSEIREKYGIKENEIVLIYVGRVVKEKGIHNLISVSKILKQKGFPIKTLIVGEGNYRMELEKNISETDNIIFCGEIEYIVLHKYYYSADIFVLPTYDDVWGLAINEAMSCSLPIITTKSAGAYLDLIKGNGYAYNADNPEELVNSIYKIMGKSVFDYREKTLDEIKSNLYSLGKVSTSIISNYTFSQSKQSLEEVIYKIKNYIQSVKSF